MISRDRNAELMERERTEFAVRNPLSQQAFDSAAHPFRPVSVIDRLQVHALLAQPLVDLVDDAFRLVVSAMGHQPARTLRNRAAYEDDDHPENRIDQESEPPAPIDRNVAGEEIQAETRSDRGAAPVSPIAGNGPSAVATVRARPGPADPFCSSRGRVTRPRKTATS